MKKLVITLTITFLVIACGKKEDQFVINGNLRGDIADGTKVYLKTAGENNTIKEIDTVTVTEGKFVFTGNTPKTLDPYYIFIEKVRGNLLVFAENGTIDLSAHKDSLMDATMSGMTQNNLFVNFLKGSNEIGKKMMSIQKDYQNAAMAKDTATVNALKEEMQEIQEEGKKYEISFIKENPNAAISPLILSNFYSRKILSDEEVSEMINNFSDEVKNTKAAKSILDALEKTKNSAIGSKAPEFSAPTPKGDTLALKDALGKITIVDFWAGWCKPCRLENPNIVKIYNKYHDKGLNILGVSLDRNADEWKNAIKEDSLTWNHVSNVKYFDEIARLYNVNSIPATFILDEKGIIVAKNLRGQQLEDKIAELLQ